MRYKDIPYECCKSLEETPEYETILLFSRAATRGLLKEIIEKLENEFYDAKGFNEFNNPNPMDIVDYIKEEFGSDL